MVAQSGNPFEIVGRSNSNFSTNTPPATIPIDTNNISIDDAALIPTTELQNEIIQEDTENIASTVQPNSNNPFEIIRNANVNVSPTKEPVLKKKTVLKKENAKSGTSTNNLLFWLLTSVLIGFAFFITIYRHYLTKVYRSFFNHNILRLSHREQRSGIDIPYLFLYLLYLSLIHI